MRYLVLFIAVAQLCCSSGTDKNNIHKRLSGDWFIIYPKEMLNNKRQEDVFTAAIQDSLVTLKGVKLITMQENGTFIQWDSTIMKGKWGTVDEKMVVVSGAGTGFENFKAEFSELEDDVPKLTEYLNVEGERIKIVWQLKKITSGKATALFDPKKNQWRNRPAKPESAKEMKQRLADMLGYYAIYFKLISEESTYFMPVRIMLPLKFYQHAIGMKEIDEQHRFNSLFYSAAQAHEAYTLLKETVNSSDYNFPDKDKNSFSLEYSMMLEKLAEEMVK